ncbi:MAG: DNA-formamidopyrimidine glycosylase [Candidatus Marinimicrobia bacterium]|nr:DNA-formamidopyrimidine glycosylase [Candidatus Neomarinimicrobiota bacterium]
MPELPEVETVVRSIRPLIMGKKIVTINTAPDYPRVLATHTPLQFKKQVVGQTIKAVSRRGKYIVLQMEIGFLLIHLRMTGRLLTKLGKNDKLKHITATVVFKDGSNLYFKDYRKFGRLYYVDSLDYLDQRLGIEPLSEEFSRRWLISRLKTSKRKIKPLLLDQSFIAGLGNIYVDEALWAAKIHPETISNKIIRNKTIMLHGAIQLILKQSIAKNGTTIINFKFGDGEIGEFVNELKIFDRTGEPCPRCNTKIIKTRVAQRGTYLCPRCQKPVK